MRVPIHRRTTEDLRRRLLHLEGLPLRPVSARAYLAALGDPTVEDEPDDRPVSRGLPAWDLDPGWLLAGASAGRGWDGLSTIAGRSWWPSALGSGPAGELLDRLWRHSVAVGISARRLAREAGDSDPELVGRAGQLVGLGWWAVAAVDPDWLLAWWQQSDPSARERMERADLGTDLDELGWRMAERWGCPELVVDAAWLRGDREGELATATSDPDRIAILREAHRRAERTPWSLDDPNRELPLADPSLRILMAEVQARCGSAFVDPTSTRDEERAVRQNARLRVELSRARLRADRAERFLDAFAASPPGETPDEWADRAARAWCAEPGVNAARITWPETESAPPEDDDRPVVPTVEIALATRGQNGATAQLWCREGGPSIARDRDESARRIVRAWSVWAEAIFDRDRLDRRLRAAVGSYRGRVRSEEDRLRLAKLDALGEFAAGAGHELNNPLAVVVGRAQLLLARAEDPEVARSLRIILAQAQRTHRILRDLMFVARPPAPRPRACKPSEVLSSVLAELGSDLETRGVRLLVDVDESSPATWGDPEGLRHLAEILLRNGIQATPPGGRVRVRSSIENGELVWSFADTGKGISPEESDHLFDPFYCGRQAGRGLGLGLPRAAKIVEQAGGRLRWSSSPGRETSFQVHLPMKAPPAPEVDSRATPRPDPALPLRLLKS